MKQSRYIAGLGLGLVGMLALLLVGCSGERVFLEDMPGMPAAAGPNTGATNRPTSGRVASGVFNIGDTVAITFNTSREDFTIPPHVERIKEDGTITPPLVGTAVAVGKTPGMLQKELQALYDRLYRGVTVTVNAGDRFYFVTGDVNSPGQKPYMSETDIVGAIATAGGFTEFANRHKIMLINPAGRTQVVDYNKALKNPQNFPVYPNFKVVVPRRKI